jgi:hypothetical protein
MGHLSLSIGFLANFAKVPAVRPTARYSLAGGFVVSPVPIDKEEGFVKRDIRQTYPWRRVSAALIAESR